jgi:hypothetical protein
MQAEMLNQPVSMPCQAGWPSIGRIASPRCGLAIEKGLKALADADTLPVRMEN